MCHKIWCRTIKKMRISIKIHLALMNLSKINSLNILFFWYRSRIATDFRGIPGNDSQKWILCDCHLKIRKLSVCGEQRNYTTFIRLLSFPNWDLFPIFLFSNNKINHLWWKWFLRCLLFFQALLTFSHL